MTIKEALYATIRTDTYDLKTIISRIEFFYAKGEITEDDRVALIEAARARAIDAMGIDVKAEISAIMQRIVAIEARLTAIEEELEPEPGPGPDPEPEPEIPDWVQPTGAHDAYNIGDRVRYQGKVYESTINGNVWSPDVYPAGWKEIEVNAAEEAAEDQA